MPLKYRKLLLKRTSGKSVYASFDKIVHPYMSVCKSYETFRSTNFAA